MPRAARTSLVRRFAPVAVSTLLIVMLGACRASTVGPTPAPVPSRPTAQTVLDKWRAGTPIRVMVLGASIGQGCCADGWERITYADDRHLSAASQVDDSVGGYVTQLRLLVRARNQASVVVNESADGYDVARAAAWLINRLLPTAPAYDIVFIPLAGNDSNRGTPVALYVQHMQSMIDALKTAGMVPVLVKENDIHDVPNARFGTPIASYMAAVDQLAASNQLSVMDGYTPFHAAVVAGGGIDSCGLFFDNDGVHPNQAGHDILFRAYEQWFNQAGR